MLHLVLPPLCASCYSHHYSQVAQTQQPAHHWTRMAKEKKRIEHCPANRLKSKLLCEVVVGLFLSLLQIQLVPFPFSVSSLFSFFCGWYDAPGKALFMTLHTEKKSSTGALTGAYIEQIVSYFWSSQCCRWLDTGNMPQPRSVLIYSWNWFQPPPFCRSCSCENALGDNFWTQGLLDRMPELLK